MRSLRLPSEATRNTGRPTSGDEQTSSAKHSISNRPENLPGAFQQVRGGIGGEAGSMSGVLPDIQFPPRVPMKGSPGRSGA